MGWFSNRLDPSLVNLLSASMHATASLAHPPEPPARREPASRGTPVITIQEFKRPTSRIVTATRSPQLMKMYQY